ncbi:MAG: hypothetical protein H0U84_01335 [Thermoleophilaceae bacterium]|nr:hypothetical protein [Thermoleophilaceae bacterium]
MGTRAILSSANTGTLPAVASWADFTLRGSPQTIQVIRSVNRIVKAHPAGADVRLAQPTIVAL